MKSRYRRRYSPCRSSPRAASLRGRVRATTTGELVEFLRGNLIGRHAQLEVVAAFLVGMNARQESRRRARMIAGTVTQRAPGHLRQSAEDVAVLTERFERLHRRGEFEARAVGLRRPMKGRGLLSEHPMIPFGMYTKPRRTAGLPAAPDRGERRYHRVEQRQSEGHAHTPQESPAWQRFIRYDHSTSKPSSSGTVGS